MRMNTDGIVLRVTDTGESDRAVTVLTRDFGVVRAFANGAKKVKSRFLGATQPLCFSRFSIYKSRNSYIIDEAQSIEVFFGLRDDIETLALAQYFCELAGELAPELDEADEFLRLLLNSLHMLVSGKRSQGQIKAVLELRILTLAGYMPELSACPHCGQEPESDIYFSVDDGCVHCRDSSHGGFEITAGVLSAMRHICTCSDKRIFAFEMPSASLSLLTEISEKYLVAQTQRKYKSLDFYKSLF